MSQTRYQLYYWPLSFRGCFISYLFAYQDTPLLEGATFDQTSLLSHCREHLAGYKVPREIRQIDELPRNPTGKILRRALKEQHAG